MSENFGLANWKVRLNSFIASAQNNPIFVAAALGVLLALGGGFYWYRTNTIKREQAAHTILVDILSQYDQAAQGKAQWDDVINMAQAGYDKFSTTSVAPYMLAAHIDALVAQDKKQEAAEKLDLMLSRIGTNSSLYDLYKLKQVLVKLDINNQDAVALEELQKLAQATSGNFSDAAQYYLGLYYQNSGDQQKAIQAWQPLMALNTNATDENGRSPWATMVEAKMNGLA